MALGNNLYQVEVSGIVLCQKDKVVIAFFLHPVIPFGNVDLTADDGLHIRMLLGILEELFYAVHVAVIGDSQRRHPQLFGPVE